MKTLIRAILLATLVSLAFAAPKISPDMPKTTSNGFVDVIIQFKTPPSTAQLQQVGAFGHVRKQFTAIKAVYATLPLPAVSSLASNPAVGPNIVYITPNRALKGSLDITTQSVNANLVWPSGYDGTGVGVAVIDSGVTPKADLLAADGVHSRVVYSQSFVAGLDATDQYGHGTHVAGIIGASGKASSGAAFTRIFKGVAPNVNLVDLRVLDANGSGNESDVISAIEQAVALKNTYNIRVMNLSLGHQVYESYTLDPLCQAAEAAWKAGIVVVTAAGNYGRDNSWGTHGYGTIVSPGNDPYVITVGAMNSHGTPFITDDSVASYSSKGPTLVDHIVKPDLVAPGNGVVSLLASPNCTLATNFPRTLILDNYYQVGTPGTSQDYFRLSGTSMATPVVSGAAALMLQKTPGLTPDQVKARLMKTARKSLPLYSTGVDAVTQITYSNQSDIFTVGAGYLDVNAALANTDLATLPALSPTAVYDPLTKTVSVIVNQAITWGDAIVWGEAIVWGDNVFINASAIVWGDAVVWGDSTTTGFAIVWGDTVNLSSPLQAATDDDGDQ
jgi:serine protease AprX